VSTSAVRDTLVVGTRGSLLARAQTRWVVDRLRESHPQLGLRIEIITTTGDRQQRRPLPQIGGKGLFTGELEQALLDGSIDLAVHSAKDLPTAMRGGLGILAFPVREDPRDAWVAAAGLALEDLPPGSVVGTTSLRRQAQLLMRRGDLTFVGLRGNVDTRIRKIHRGDCAGAVLAMAGLNRAGLSHHVTYPFEPAVMLPAPGQGALAVQGRNEDERAREYLRAVHDESTAAAVGCERAILEQLDAGCRAPVAILASVVGTDLRCEALVTDLRGQRCVRASASLPVADPVAVVNRIVSDLRAGGAEEIIAACRQ